MISTTRPSERPYDITDLGTLNFDDATTLTIASGAVTKTQSYHSIDTEGIAASDDLDTINGGTAGDLLYLKAADDTHTVVLKHGTGNIVTPDGSDYSLDDANKVVALLFDGTNWHLVGSAGGTSTFTGLTDTPSSYTGYAGYSPVVNAAETGLEFEKRTSESPADTTIYVDYTNGSDTIGDGSSGNPYKTIQKAIDELPTLISKTVEIAVSGGPHVLSSAISFAGKLVTGSLTVKAKDTSGNDLYDSGTATGGSATTLEDTSKSWTTDFWADGWVFIWQGTGAGDIRSISSNTATVLTIDSGTAPDTTSDYVIVKITIDCNNIAGYAVDYLPDNLSLLGFRYINIASDAYTIHEQDGKNFTLKYSLFDDADGRGLSINGGTSFIYYNLFHLAGYPLCIGNLANCTPRGNCAIAQSSGNGTAVYIERGSIVAMTYDDLANTFINWGIGVKAQYNALCTAGTEQVFTNCTTNYTPSSSSDASYIM